MKYLKMVLFTVLVLAVASCTTFQVSGTQMTLEMPSFDNIGELDVTVSVTEWLGASGGANLLNVSSTNMDDAIYDAIQREIRQASGDAAVNVTIKYEASFINYLLNGLTWGIYAPLRLM